MALLSSAKFRSFAWSFTEFRKPLLWMAAAAALLPAAVNAPAQELAEDPGAAGGLTPEERKEQFEQAITQGQEKYLAGEFAEAVALFDQAVQVSGGSNPTTYLLRAKALVELEEYEAAIEDIKEMLNAFAGTDSPLIAEARSTRAEIYLETGNLEGALRDAQYAVKENRNNLQYQLIFGKIAAQTGQAPAAVKALTKYLEADDQNAEAFRFRAQAYAGQGKFELALVDIGKAIELEPQAHESHMARAQVHMLQREYKPAAEALRDALAVYEPADPDLPMPFAQAHLMRASALEEIGKQAEDAAVAKEYFEEEKREVETLLETLPDNPAVAATKASALFQLGVAERLLQNYPAAVKAHSEAIDINPGFGQAYFRRGICYYYMNEPRLALDDFEQGAAINFQNPRSDLWRGRCHNQLRDYREAIKSFSAAVAVSDRYTTAYEHRGLVYLQISEFDKALKDFNKTVRLEPEVGRYHYLRGVAFERLNEDEKAINAHTNAIEKEATLVEAYDALARLFTKAGRRGLAEEYRREADRLRSKQAAK